MAEIIQLVENGEKKYMKSHAAGVDGLLDFIYPVGSIYATTKDINPSQTFGGTWQRFAKGQTLVGVDENDSDFSNSKKIGGAKTHKLSISELPSHNFDTSLFRGEAPTGSAGTGGYAWGERSLNDGNRKTNTLGGDVAHNNMQPYITVYYWERTA